MKYCRLFYRPRQPRIAVLLLLLSLVAPSAGQTPAGRRGLRRLNSSPSAGKRSATAPAARAKSNAAALQNTTASAANFHNTTVTSSFSSSSSIAPLQPTKTTATETGRLNPHPHHVQSTRTLGTMVGNFFGMLAGVAYSFGGIVPFIPQYQRIQRKRSDRGFSTTVCLILLIANVLRIEFWMLKRFSVALLLQSVSMISAQLMLLELCIRVRCWNGKDKMTVGESLGLREKSSANSEAVLDSSTGSNRLTSLSYSSPPPRFWENPLGANFWAWADFADYIAFVASFAMVTSFVSWLFSWSSIYAEILGSTSVTIEAIILVPQLIQNWERQSTEGLSYAMMIMWCAGDFMKLTYFTASQVPIQFVLCAVVQCLIDVVIMLQIFTYSSVPSGRKPVPAARRLSKMIRSGLSQRRAGGRHSSDAHGSSRGGRRERLPTNFEEDPTDASPDRTLLSVALEGMGGLGRSTTAIVSNKAY